ncbi:bifunctional UDP-N-acetylglucosamine diphosphorylase/glucosamine-1-phosphate N-acetyltransferase GlmU [Immundisolibacter sp.]|uniref:bifunctional UDP-N-acetylglucosamine diphosphorylase/glucosamine-1-phosphate N-acetyltransferase GlmU n=1 Tax=Immundisolibacter sp. TaxID=1934948 RepID=UPI002612C185|nr:bifunctional UDP-N-acetylglucosamine diphosphorylase/glucosamine-1-phosphate N-acetyltransferase GlmU [Immundisolibacter sp.]MDD3651437.1 bifunctional UDP-N-acetylglucosamine diphosphorylase/glucosamine-1-phosphate N-acetyltransferase GlmU [Immundisolibacter sp.]
MTDAPLQIVILAAGQGKRMRSARPKVLQPLGGRALIDHVLATAEALLQETGSTASPVLVYGHGGDELKAHLEGVAACRWAHQAAQRGTGDAVAAALPLLEPRGRVLVLCGDVPLLRGSTLRALLATPHEALAILTASVDDPTGYGRILRAADGAVRGIVEQRDAGPDQLAVREINTGTLLIPAARLAGWLGRLGDDNAQGERYLTDIVAMAVADGVPVVGVPAADETEILGVNDRAQLARCERELQRRLAERLLDEGVTLRDPARLDVRGDVSVGRDVEIDVGVIFEGRVVLGDGVRIGAHCILRDAIIGPGARIEPFSLVEGARVGPNSVVGPYARLRPGTELAQDVHIGNFVEVKNSRLGTGAKANHLSYLGDAAIGARVNIGAGTITCNYDGAAKHRTVIGDDAFIGSNSSLVAPVTIGEDATIGAGSVISREAPPGGLTLTRAAQKTIPGWQRPRKKPAS